MPPDQADGQPRPLEEHRHRDLIPVAPDGEGIILATGSNQQRNMLKHDLPKERQLEGATKRAKLYGDTEKPAPKSHIIPMEEYREMTEVLHRLQENVTEKDRKLTAECQKHEVTKFDLAKAKNERKDMKRDLEAVRTQLEDTKREREATKSQLRDCQNALAAAHEKFDTRDQDAEDAMKKLERAEQEVQALRLVNDTNGAHNMEIHATLKDFKAALAKERRDNHKEVAKLKKKTECLKEQHEDLRNKMESEWNETKTDLLKKLRESRGHDHRYINKVPDEKVKEMLGGLKFKIEQFINNNLQQTSDAVDQNLEPIWKELAPDARQFLDSAVLRNLILEAYIWEWLRHTIFTLKSSCWAEGLGNRFSQLLEIVQARIKGPENDQKLYADYQYWRSSSNNFLARLESQRNNLEVCRTDANAMVMNLSKFCDSLDIDGATTVAMDIFNDARDLDITLRTLKAEFIWVFGDIDSENQLENRFGFACTKDHMGYAIRHKSDTFLGKAPKVDLVVTPALFKRGNNDGADYQTLACCIPMKVVCNASRFYQGAKTSIDVQAGTRNLQEAGRVMGSRRKVGKRTTRQSSAARKMKIEDATQDEEYYTGESDHHATSPFTYSTFGAEPKEKKRKSKRRVADSDDEDDKDYKP